MRNSPVVKDLIHQTTLETGNRVFTLKSGLLPPHIQSPVINLSTLDQNAVDLAREELEVFYFRNKTTAPLGQEPVNFEIHKQALETGTFIYAYNKGIDGDRIVASAHFNRVRRDGRLDPQVQVIIIQQGDQIRRNATGYDEVENEIDFQRRLYVGELETMPVERRLNAVVVRAAHDHWVNEYSKLAI